MNDDRRKRLNNFLGRRCYSTPDDMVDLAKKLVETGKWRKAETFLYNYWKERSREDEDLTDFIAWLICDPARTCDLVGEFLEVEEK